MRLVIYLDSQQVSGSSASFGFSSLFDPYYPKRFESIEEIVCPMDSNSNFKIPDLIHNQPQFSRDSTLDRLFEEFNVNILTKLSAFKHTNTSTETLYESLKCENNEEFVRKLIKYLIRIHDSTCEEQRVLQSDASNLLPISLQDMKYLEELIHLIIIHGIDANLPRDYTISFDRDTLNGTMHNELKYNVPGCHKVNSDTLSLLVNTLYPIFMKGSIPNDYVRSIMLKSPLYANFLLALLSLSLCQPSVKNTEMFVSLETVQETYELFAIYTLLFESLKDPQGKSTTLTRLSTLPVRRENGVLSLIDFLTGARENEHIDLEKLKRVTQILIAKPKTMSSVEYFSCLFPQIYEGLSHINRPVVVACLNNVITTLYFKNSKIIRDFLFTKVYQVLFNDPLKAHGAKELNDTFNVLLSLTRNSSMKIVEALIMGYDKKGFFLNIWVYALFLKKNQKINPVIVDKDGKKIQEDSGSYYKGILSLLKSFIVLTGCYEVLDTLSLNLVNYKHEKWGYSLDLETHLAHVRIQDDVNGISNEILLPTEQVAQVSDLFQDMDLAIDLFMELLRLIDDDEVIKDIFLTILSRWVRNTSKGTSKEKTRATLENGIGDDILSLIDLKTLEKLNKEFKSDVIKKPVDVLTVIEGLMDFVHEDVREQSQNEGDSDDEEDEFIDENETMTAFNTVLELLSTILSNSSNKDLYRAKEILKSIDMKLMIRSGRNKRCHSLHELILNVIEDKNITTDTNIQYEELEEDRETLCHAMMNLNDLLEPIKVQGLRELISLIEKGSPVVTTEKVLNLHLQSLHNQDPFIYLNAITGLTTLCKMENKQTLGVLLKFYNNVDGRNSLDDILKVGEVLINYIQKENELFQGTHANAIIDACLATIRRYGEVDNRLRMSAISILGVCLKVNAIGIQARIGDILDCSFGILQLEKDRQESKSNNNSFMVRRAAIHLLHDLMYNAGLSLFPKRYNYQKLKELLHYVKESDEDFLVREQANILVMLTESHLPYGSTTVA